MNGKHLRTCLAIMLVLGPLAGGLVATGAETKKKVEIKPPSGPSAAAVPEIARIAVYQNQQGEPALLSPLAIARDNQNGDLIVSSFESGEVVILDKNGVLIKRLGSESGLVSPYGVALDSKGKIYVSEMKTGFLKVLSPGGSLVDEFDLSKVMGKSVAPGRITLDKEGLIYLADLNNREVIILDGKGNFVKSLGQFDYLQKAGAVDGNRILGLSAMGKAVQVYNRDGALLHSFGEHGDSPEKNFSFPTGFAVDTKGRLWIADAFQHLLKVYTLEGKFLFNFGRMEEKSGGFFFPVDICFGEKGKLIVLEKGANRIQVFQVGDLKE